MYVLRLRANIGSKFDKEIASGNTENVNKNKNYKEKSNLRYDFVVSAACIQHYFTGSLLVDPS